MPRAQQMLLAAVAGMMCHSAALAHPTQLRFQTRGECEKAQASVNNFDREYVAEPVFNIENNGEAQVFFLESFQCERDPATGLWRMVDQRPDQSDIGQAWDN